MFNRQKIFMYFSTVELTEHELYQHWPALTFSEAEIFRLAIIVTD